MPGLTDGQFVHEYLDPVRHSRRATTVLGALSLVLGTLGLHDSVDWSVSRLWQCPKSRSFWLNKVRGALVVVWAAGLALLTLGLTSMWLLALNTVHAGDHEILGWLTLVPSLVLDSAVFAALYRLTPTISVRTRAALIAGVLAALFWESTKLIFVGHSGRHLQQGLRAPCRQHHRHALALGLGHRLSARSRSYRNHTEALGGCGTPGCRLKRGPVSGIMSWPGSRTRQQGKR